MLKKTQIFIILVIVMIVVAGVLMLLREIKEKNKQEFLSQLKGQVVFTRRDADGVSDIWKINANGTSEEMLFHNDLEMPSWVPQWSEDGKKIFFISFDQDKKKDVYEINTDGSNFKLKENKEEYRKEEYRLDDTTSLSREKDIIVENGDVFYLLGQEKIKIYDYKFKCDSKLCPGASEASWSPDKKYIIFNGDAGIFIADLKGNVFKLTDGADPDWK